MSAERGTALIILHEPRAGGATLALRRLEPLLEADGWRIAYWGIAGSPLWEELAAEGVLGAAASRPVAFSLRGLRESPGPLARLRGLRPYFESLQRFAAEIGADIVHANTILTAPEARAMKRAGFPVVLHVHEMFGSMPKDRAAAALVRRSADVTITVSAACATALGRHGIDARVVYGGVASPPQTESAPDPPVTVGSIGTVTRRKGSDVFVEAARLLRSRKDLAFEMVGSTRGTFEATWARDVVERGVAVGVTHYESAEIEAVLASWDIFVLPSRADPFPNVILEAMAAGLPVVASSVDGIAEQVTTNTGILVPPGDAQALARAIEAVARDPDRRRMLGAAGRDRVAGKFTLGRQASGISRAWTDAIEINRAS